MSERSELIERRDVVVIGGGIAGLSAAWRLRDRDVVLLEASDRLGGRVRSEPYGEYWMNYGAHLFPAPGSLVDTMAREVGLEMVPVWGGMMGLAVGDKRLTSGRIESYPFRLPLSLLDRAAFAIKGLQIQRAVASYQKNARPGPDDTPAMVRDRVLGFLDDRTFAEFLGPMPKAVEAIFSAASHRATAELSEISAGGGIGLFALVWGGKKSLIARNLLGGTGRLPAAMGAELGDAARTHAKAEAIRPDGDGLIVEYLDHGTPRRIRARHLVLAAQAPFASGLVADIAPAASEALGKMSYGAFLSVAVATKETASMPWDDVYAMATPGRVFDMFTNQGHALRAPGQRKPGGTLMLFAGAQAAAALMAESDEAIVDRFVKHLVGLYPEARGLVGDARVQRWPMGNVYAQPGRQRLQAAIEGPLGPHANIHLAGDYFAELGNLEMAARTGAAAAERVASMLDQGDSPSQGDSPTTAQTEAVR